MQEKTGQGHLLHRSFELEEEGPHRWQIRVDVNPPWQWNVLINTMENYLKKSETLQDRIGMGAFVALPRGWFWSAREIDARGLG